MLRYRGGEIGVGSLLGMRDLSGANGTHLREDSSDSSVLSCRAQGIFKRLHNLKIIQCIETPQFQYQNLRIMHYSKLLFREHGEKDHRVVG